MRTTPRSKTRLAKKKIEVSLFVTTLPSTYRCTCMLLTTIGNHHMRKVGKHYELNTACNFDNGQIIHNATEWMHSVTTRKRQRHQGKRMHRIEDDKSSEIPIECDSDRGRHRSSGISIERDEVPIEDDASGAEKTSLQEPHTPHAAFVTIQERQ